MGVDLRGDNLLLNPRQQLLCFGQRHTQVGDIARTVRRLTAIMSKLRD
jgi:hypothetical protein